MLASSAGYAVIIKLTKLSFFRAGAWQKKVKNSAYYDSILVTRGYKWLKFWVEFLLLSSKLFIRAEWEKGQTLHHHTNKIKMRKRDQMIFNLRSTNLSIKTSEWKMFINLVFNPIGQPHLSGRNVNAWEERETENIIILVVNSSAQ